MKYALLRAKANRSLKVKQQTKKTISDSQGNLKKGRKKGGKADKLLIKKEITNQNLLRMPWAPKFELLWKKQNRYLLIFCMYTFHGLLKLRKSSDNLSVFPLD